MSDLIDAVTVVTEAEPGYSEALNYYDGTIDEVFASAFIARLLGQSASNYRLNLARRPVDAVLDRLKIAAITVPNDQGATTFLENVVWRPNYLGRVAKVVHRNALVCGDAYVIAWPGDTDGSVELHYNSPTTVRVFYDPENPHRTAFAAKVWHIGSREDKQTRVNLYYPDRIERWISRHGTTGSEDDQYDEFTDDDTAAWPTPNPYGVVPVFHFRSDDPYGRPEHIDAYGPQNAITKLAATMMTTVDYQGFPQRYRLRALNAATLADGARLGDSLLDDDDNLPGDDAPLEAHPGTILDLPDTQSVGQFPNADMDAFLRPLAFFIRAMASTTATPLRFFDPTGQIPSGQALRADEAPLAEKIGDRQTWFGDEWRDLLTFAMAVAGNPVSTVDVQWQPVQVASDEDDWRTIRLKLLSGVPFRHAMIEAGYRPEIVDSWPTPVVQATTQQITSVNGGLPDIGSDPGE